MVHRRGDAIVDDKTFGDHAREAVAFAGTGAANETASHGAPLTLLPLLFVGFAALAEDPAPVDTPAPAAQPAPESPPPEPTAPQTPPEEAPPSPPPSPGFPEIPLDARGIVLPASSSPPSTTKDFWSDGEPGSYLTWYGPEWAAVALAAGLYLGGVHKQITPAPALLGPRFDLDEPELAVLFDPRLDDAIGRPMLKEKVPDEALIGAVAVVVLGTAGVDLAAGGDAHRTHALLLGGLEAVLGTVAVTEALKLSMGRLRPDFRDRWVRAACAGNVPAPDDLDCASVDDGFVVSEKDVLDGMKSFPSGHASTSFALLSYATLAIGSRWIWADATPGWTPAVATAVVGTLAAGAAYASASRLSDHRHHPEDVAVGAALGATIGASMWFVHFDVDGKARTRWPVQVVPQTAMGATATGSGLAVTGAF